MRVHIGSDHAGLEMKQRLVPWLRSHGYEPVDHGPETFDAEDDYPTFCIPVGEAVVAEPGSLAIVLGGSGNGEQIAANKVPGVRAALVWSEETARLGRQHNDANVLAVGARMHQPSEIETFVRTFLETGFTAEERHRRRIGQLADYEDSRSARVRTTELD